MPCCKAEEYDNWCAAEPTVEYEGEEYCIFHAPAECPEKQDVEAFNKKVFERIDKCKKDGEECDLRGAIFPGYISFSAYDKDNPLPNITFSQALFCNAVSFDSVTFGGISEFYDVRFDGYVNFAYAEFKGYVDFGLSIISESSSFMCAIFSSFCEFSQTEFCGRIDFLETIFCNICDFGHAIFNGHLDFTNSKFHQLVVFYAADQLDMSCDHTHFCGPVLFRDIKILSCRFDDCIIDKHIEFERADISRLSLLRAPIESMRFIDCIWPESKGRKVVYDSRSVQGQGYFPLFNVFGADRFSELNKPPEPGRLADLFRRLKKVARDGADEPLASDWHYAEKEMQRLDAKQNKRPWFALGLWLYKLVSGYGESPSRAGLWLVVLALLPWLAHECLDVIMKTLPRDPLPNVQTLAWLNAAFSTPKEYISASINHDATGCYLYTLWLRIYQTLLLVQAGLFGLAVRNKMRR